MDRNVKDTTARQQIADVALRKESVDRNAGSLLSLDSLLRSLSARRAWIEIRAYGVYNSGPYVALRKESVDRNLSVAILISGSIMSLSARRAWIEISARHRAAPQK